MNLPPCGIDVEVFDIVNVTGDDGYICETYATVAEALRRAPFDGETLLVGDVPLYHAVDGEWVPTNEAFSDIFTDPVSVRPS